MVAQLFSITLAAGFSFSYSISSSGERPSESFSLNFTKITKQYDAFDGDKKKTGTPRKWDLMANKTF